MTPDARNLVVGVLLAGGLSRRMGGGDKCLRDLAGKPMLQHVIDRFGPQVGGLLINANGDPARFASFGLPVVADMIAGFPGPLAGVLSGMRWAMRRKREVRWVATVSTDVPFLPLDLVSRLLVAINDRPGAIALASSNNEAHPVVGLWPVALADDLECALEAGARKVLQWTDRHGTVLVDFPFLRFHGRLIDPFFNANTPEELDEARALIESRCQ
ncbi:MAG TPA: molybdenum cofactor guanylyltransferase MobA [Hyphomicrobiaceae bacterium]|jgi:molybdopterin-guanine dinucleotide biosynthesis protein A|nr:molybdenum cofactor guanylyltransferase MobA [Hyphomicrobiaceae bacterium]